MYTKTQTNTKPYINKHTNTMILTSASTSAARSKPRPCPSTNFPFLDMKVLPRCFNISLTCRHPTTTKTLTFFSVASEQWPHPRDNSGRRQRNKNETKLDQVSRSSLRCHIDDADFTQFMSYSLSRQTSSVGLK